VHVDNATSTGDAVIIDTTTAGTHTITYFVTDPAGLTGSVTRTVIVAASTTSAANYNTATSFSACRPSTGQRQSPTNFCIHNRNVREFLNAFIANSILRIILTT